MSGGSTGRRSWPSGPRLNACPAEGRREKLWGEPEESLVEVEAGVVSVLGSQARQKGEVSAEVTGSLRRELTPWCAACTANHPRESVFRATPLLGRTWRGAARGSSYEVTVTPFERLPAAVWSDVETQAERVARMRGRRVAGVVRLPVP